MADYQLFGHYPGSPYNLLTLQPNRRELTGEEERRLSVVFYNADMGDKGYLTKEDLKVAVVSLFGYKPSKYEVQDIMHTIKLKEDQGISMQEFYKVMTPKVLAQDRNEEIRHIFMAFDIQCKGFIRCEDVLKAFSQIMPHMPTHRIYSLFREIDRDGDNRVSYKDFELMMNYNLENGL